MYRYFKKTGSTNHISEWKSKGLSDGSIKPPSTSDNSLALAINYFDTSKVRVNFSKRCLKQHYATLTHKK